MPCMLYNVEGLAQTRSLKIQNFCTTLCLFFFFFPFPSAGFKIGHSVEAATAAPSFRIRAYATGRHGSSKEF